MSKLVLIKHSAPLVDPATPSHLWKLSDAGREKCTALADALRAHAPELIVASEEPKAQETAELVAHHLGIPASSAAGLHEHDRSNVPHMRSAEFISMVELFFRRQEELVLGTESASQAMRRISAAIDDVLNAHPDESVAIVTHGTVLALYLAPLAERPAFELWREMGLPSFAVLDRASKSVSRLVARV